MKFSNVLLQITKMNWKQPEHDEERSDFTDDVKDLLPQEKEIKNNAVKKNTLSHKNLKIYQLGYQAQVKLDKEKAKQDSSIVAQKYNKKFNPSI